MISFKENLQGITCQSINQSRLYFRQNPYKREGNESIGLQQGNIGYT